VIWVECLYFVLAASRGSVRPSPSCLRGSFYVSARVLLRLLPLVLRERESIDVVKKINKSIDLWWCFPVVQREQPLLSTLVVFDMGWVIKGPSQGAAAEMLPKTHHPTYSSWTPRDWLQARSLSLSSVVGHILQQHSHNEEISDDRMDKTMDHTYTNLMIEKAKAQTLWTDKNNLWTRKIRRYLRQAIYIQAISQELQSTAMQCSILEIASKQCSYKLTCKPGKKHTRYNQEWNTIAPANCR